MPIRRNKMKTNWTIEVASVSGSKPLPITLACKEKFPRKNFQHSVMFSPAEYEYECHFSITSRFSEMFKQRRINKKKGCLQVVSMLKVTNKFNVLHT